VSSAWRQRLSTWTLLTTVLLGVRVSAAEHVHSNVVLLEAVGSPVDVDALRTSLEDWLRSMQLELHLVGVMPPEAEPSFARVRVVWTDETCVVEVFGEGGALRRRKSLPRGGPPLLVSESAALIAQAGVQELSVEESKRHPLPAPVAVVPVEVHGEPLPDAASSPFGLDVGAYAQGRTYDGTAPFVMGGGAEVAASFGDGPWHPGGLFLLAYQGPISRQFSLGQLDLQTVELRLLPTLRRKVGPFEAEFGLGGGLDLLLVHTIFGLHRRDEVVAAPFFTIEAALRWKVTPASAIFLRAVVDLDPARRRFIADAPGLERETIIFPWIARPALQLGFSFDLVSQRESAP
jgi:hypothetical protein